MHIYGRQRGFAALMSVVILAGMLMVMTYVMSTASFFARFDALDGERKRVSLSLADGCLAAAMARLQRDSDYVPTAGGECVSLGGECDAVPLPSGTCKICGVAPGEAESERIVVVRAADDGAYTNVRAVLVRDSGAYEVREWREVPHYDGPNCTL